MPATGRAAELVAALDLQPHVEGGHYRRFYTAAAADGARPALSAIHFLLAAGEVSAWHAVDAEEAWHYAEGDPLELLIYRPAERRLERHRLGPLVQGGTPACVVPAHAWQAARPLGGYTLVTCTVAPAFEFAGFRLLADEPFGDTLRSLLASPAR
ncbi:cupin domain-containing protein [Dyella sp. BiH032]|uniref:cupin domain-containing protein n=1 Tax=Dyella sp. BiH032 TaxID=3075430 RepID=UPI002893718E|nr:cupin domain-containing protein [Dyella sp. BiH032]WNL46651.1 cupin domain-containing protein [Dyella sp. BiH032]